MEVRKGRPYSPTRRISSCRGWTPLKHLSPIKVVDAACSSPSANLSTRSLFRIRTLPSRWCASSRRPGVLRRQSVKIAILPLQAPSLTTWLTCSRSLLRKSEALTCEVLDHKPTNRCRGITRRATKWVPWGSHRRAELPKTAAFPRRRSASVTQKSRHLATDAQQATKNYAFLASKSPFFKSKTQ